MILFNHDNDTATTPIAVRNFYDVMDPAAADDPRPRSDVRFGVGSEGEMYITNEVDGWVYIVENSTPNGFTLPGGDPFSIDPPPSAAVDAISDHRVLDNDTEVLPIFAFGGAAGILENDQFSGSEPIINAVNGLPHNTTNSDSQPERTVAGSNGGLFAIAADGQLNFYTNGDFDDLGFNESRASAARYTVLAPDGSVDTAEAIMTVRGNADRTLDVTLAGNGARSTLVVGSSPAFLDTNEWTITQAPVALTDSILLPRQTSPNRLERTLPAASFTPSDDGYVYVALEVGATLPSWMQTPEWVDTNEFVAIANGSETVSMNLYGMRFEAGDLVDIGGADSNATGARFQSIIMVSDTALFEDPETTTFEFANKRYELVGRGQSWTQAQATASDLGGTIARPTNDAESSFLAEVFGVKGPIWVDATDAGSEGNFVSSDGTPLSYVNWIDGELNEGANNSADYGRIVRSIERSVRSRHCCCLLYTSPSPRD